MQRVSDRGALVHGDVVPADPAMVYSIHFLRFLAALAIVLHHVTVDLGSPIMTGAAGVDVFFIISGTVIGLSAKPGQSPVKFGINRFIRVVPLYWIATAAIATVRFWAWDVIPDVHDILHSVFLIPSARPAWVPIYYPGWTLSYEMLFYAVFGVLLTFFSGKKLVPMAMIAMASLAAGALPIPGLQPQLCLEFVFGLLVCETITRKIVLDRRTGTICIVVSVVLFSIHYTTPQFRLLQWGVPALLLVFGMLSYETSRVWRHPLLVLCGSASYAIYLSHVTVHTLAYTIEPKYGAGGLGHKILVFVIELSTALTAGVAFHLMIERPLIAGLRAARDKVFQVRGLARG